ncbi:MAG: hypothetical protein COW73_06420 [Nitrospirae bacterium CG18_big_fil_WC_8_21_14_2_50_70_55]|nr:prepilin-type N-terminal cleavage/methylation domain-containing protein [Deltaproteobacteria bacterium]OIP63596.1 MAG: hypothetical protein AUK30_08210 [Nitrospirae bacterium CG2_30_70_394]PIQ05168.1 MAG: hypothetical protein COW73_06420 [Nitrospirae bacterium CG18_big_fil_WC_8_21_14_2_50_70_55]PIU79605.1 MAG: hypothetical protein COS73_03720 [Nitrospirae bacterium CG06_land_8_20_14_3_00_70_43]PIW83131.1 MAG: hypothetical protein COZ96_05010 [Nitrospirae bacterium CG_4_8_14_3_um_filter_70_85
MGDRHPSCLGACPAAGGERGFTLVEVMITLGLLGLVFTLVYGALWSTVGGLQRMERRGSREQAVRILLEMIDRELRSTLWLANDPRLVFVGEDAVTDDGRPADRLTWVHASHLKLHPDLPESDVAEVTYGFHATGESRYVLVKREDATPEGDPMTGGAEYLLSEELVGLDFHYYGPTGWVEEWDSRQSNSLPRLVQVSLFLAPEDEVEGAEPVEIRSIVEIPMGEQR